MFEVGFSELLLICVIALIVLGPQRLPKLAAQVGRWMGRARAMARQFHDQLEDEARAVEFNLDKEVAPRAADASANNAAPAAAVTPTAVSGTLATGIPPEDDFAHHDAPALDTAPAEANSTAPAVPDTAPKP